MFRRIWIIRMCTGWIKWSTNTKIKIFTRLFHNVNRCVNTVYYCVSESSNNLHLTYQKSLERCYCSGSKSYSLKSVTFLQIGCPRQVTSFQYKLVWQGKHLIEAWYSRPPKNVQLITRLWNEIKRDLNMLHTEYKLVITSTRFWFYPSLELRDKLGVHLGQKSQSFG